MVGEGKFENWWEIVFQPEVKGHLKVEVPVHLKVKGQKQNFWKQINYANYLLIYANESHFYRNRQIAWKKKVLEK